VALQKGINMSFWSTAIHFAVKLTYVLTQDVFLLPVYTI